MVFYAFQIRVWGCVVGGEGFRVQRFSVRRSPFPVPRSTFKVGREEEEILTMKDILVQSATLRLRLLHGTGEDHEGKREEKRFDS